MDGLDAAVNEPERLRLSQIVLVIGSTVFASLVAANLGASIFVAMIPETRCNSPFENDFKERCPDDFQRYLVPEIDGKLSVCLRYNFSLVEKELSSVFNCSAEINTTGVDLVSCADWGFDKTVMARTIVTDFRLVCDDVWASYLSQSALMLGVGVGTIVVGYISDRIGRRHALLLSSIGAAISGTVLSFTKTYLAFSIVRTIVGTFAFCPFMVLIVYVSELTVPRYRAYVVQAQQLSFPIGFMYLALCSYAVRDWRYVQLLISVPFALGIILWWLMPESRRWLLDSNRTSENRISSSKRNYNAGKGEVEVVKSPSVTLTTAASASEVKGMKSLIKLPHLRSTSLKMFFNWFTVSCAYYGLTLNAAQLNGDPFLNLCYNALSEMASIVVTVPMANICGRRVTGVLSNFLAGITCIFVAIIPENAIFAAAIFGKFAISISFNIMEIHTSEIYSTTIRNVGMGLCSSMARVGGIVSPLIAMLAIVQNTLPYVIFGVLPILSALCVMSMPETKGKNLPQTIEEGEDLIRNDRGILRNIRCCPGN